MRRSQTQSVRVGHYPRPSLALAADDLGMLREGDESNEDVLRRQLLEKDRENDKLQTQVQTLQALLAGRPPLETVQELEKEYKNLELLLQGTQRENERCMTELDRGKTREKMLERELAKLAGENWQSSLDITISPSTTSRSAFNQRSNTSFNGSPHTLPTIHSNMNLPPPEGDQASEQQEQQARIEQVRMLILGMEQRMQVREEKLTQSVERAQGEAKKFEQIRTEILFTSA